MNLRQIATAAIALSSLMFGQTAPLFAQNAQQQGFHIKLPQTHNPFSIYTPINVPAPSLANSVRLDQCIHNGKLYLSLDDAIDLALENNLDLAVSRFNLPIASMDVLRTAAGAQSLGVNTSVVQNTLGGAAATSVASSSGVGGIGGGVGGLVQNTFGLGPFIPSFDPHIIGTASTEHLTQPQVNQVTSGTASLKTNTIIANASYQQSFPTGTYVEFDFNNQRQTINSPFSTLNPSLNSNYRFLIQQQLLAGFGFSPNLRYLRLAKNNRKISEIAFKQQVIATSTQIENIYWDLESAYLDEQVKERSLAFAEKSLDDERKQLQLKAVPAMDVMKAESEVAQRQQDLTISKTTLQLQESFIKSALTKQLDQTLEEMPVIPTASLEAFQPESVPSVPDLIEEALKDRPDVNLLQINEDDYQISRKAVRNAMLPTVSVTGFYAGFGLGGVPNPDYPGGAPVVTTPLGYGGTLQNTFNNTSPDYLAEVQLIIPLRNRQARADQFRSELEYRQAQLQVVQQKKNLRIEVRNAAYSLEQGGARVEAARKARDLAQRTFDIMRQEQQLGAGSNFQTLSAEHDLAIASSALAAAETTYEKYRVELYQTTGQTLTRLGISLEEARAGVVNKPVSPLPPSALQPPPAAMPQPPQQQEPTPPSTSRPPTPQP
ncbi:MAG TPA: TolC family protein [Acidobacteriaceae bacterium]|jgi:outer membrane protein TolC|nr:TolC family protein [Acidobacteriaceae bacterium]